MFLTSSICTTPSLQFTFIIGLGMLGLREAELYLMTIKKMPKNAPWGELPGRDFGEKKAPSYVRIIDLLIKYEERMRRSQGGTCMSYRSSITIW